MRHLLLVRFVVALAVGATVLGGCQKEAATPPPPPPSEGVLSAMRDFCRVGEMPKEKQAEAFKLWGWHIGGDKEMGPLWHRAIVKKDPAARALLREAALTASGGNCKPIEALK